MGQDVDLNTRGEERSGQQMGALDMAELGQEVEEFQIDGQKGNDTGKETCRERQKTVK